MKRKNRDIGLCLNPLKFADVVVVGEREGLCIDRTKSGIEEELDLAISWLKDTNVRCVGAHVTCGGDDAGLFIKVIYGNGLGPEGSRDRGVFFSLRYRKRDGGDDADRHEGTKTNVQVMRLETVFVAV